MRDGAHIITLGNEKGGSGKSTVAMHIVVALLREGFRVGSIDLDNRQWTLSRYLTNRGHSADAGRRLPLPTHFFLPRSEHRDREAAEVEETEGFERILGGLAADQDFVVIDCPGSDTHLGRLAHAVADTLVTPMNDSFVDLDLLASVDADSLEIRQPSIYSEMVWEARKRKAQRRAGSIDWIVARNRLSSLVSRNKMDVADVVARLSKRIGFRVASGLSERVIYRELFLKGLTLLDLMEGDDDVAMSMSHVAARNEIRLLVATLRLPTPRSTLDQAGTSVA